MVFFFFYWHFVFGREPKANSYFNVEITSTVLHLIVYVLKFLSNLLICGRDERTMSWTTYLVFSVLYFATSFYVLMSGYEAHVESHFHMHDYPLSLIHLSSKMNFL